MLVNLSGKASAPQNDGAARPIRLSGARARADRDVDAPNLHLVNRHYSSGETAPYWVRRCDIDPALCNSLRECEVTVVGAIIPGAPCNRVDPYACEGCGVCVLVCPTDAINMSTSRSRDRDAVRTGKQVVSRPRSSEPAPVYPGCW